MASFKLGPQARYLVKKMTEWEKNIHEVMSRLTSQLVAIECKVDSNAADMGQVQEKVDLVMTTINAVQNKQVQVVNQLKLSSAASGVPGGDGIIGVAHVSTSSANMRSPTPPPPLPPLWTALLAMLR
jgi:DNA anti-recombination protein RmuC